jgi:Pentapeptide repeats (9 copies)
MVVIYPPSPTVALLPKEPAQAHPGLLLANVTMDGDRHGADFSRCALRNVNFTGADLRECDFGSATLQGCDFTGADMEHVTLEDATFDAGCRWPVGFDPVEHGRRRK